MAAHPHLPFGTVLEVCYRGCTRVTVNDRNPYSAAELDLSRAAADDIGLTPDGYGVVDAEVLHELSNKGRRRENATATGKAFDARRARPPYRVPARSVA